MFERSNIRIHFQADNPGLTVTEDGGIHYIRASGAWGIKPPFFALVTVNGDSTTVEFPDVSGGSAAPSVEIQ